MSESHLTPEAIATQEIRRLFYRFARLKTSGALVMLGCAAVGLVWANSPWSHSYFELLETEITVAIGSWSLTHSFLHWINDGLMALFFFVMGLEIKREFLAGELASPRRAFLPVAGAVGGMLMPAIIYGALNLGGPHARGWGVPMATDIAFSLGVLALVGTGIPLGLKVFLAALAIADDIGTVLVIAVFYTGEIEWVNLIVGACILLALMVVNRAEVRRPLPYALLGLALWFVFLKSGIHSTVAGILVAMMVPARSHIRGDDFVAKARGYLSEFECVGEQGHTVLVDQHCQAVIDHLKTTAEAAGTPLQRLSRVLHPWVSFAVLPLFALVNAGVVLRGGEDGMWGGTVTLGVVAGLVLGKPIGITLLSWLAVRFGFASLPTGVTWRQMWGAGCLAGIGFTISMLIAGLAFEDGTALPAAKMAILGGSLISGIIGWVILRGIGGADVSVWDQNGEDAEEASCVVRDEDDSACEPTDEPWEPAPRT